MTAWKFEIWKIECWCIILKVRGATAVVLLASAEQLQAEDWEVLGTEQLLKIAGKLVSDNTPDARNAAKKLIVLLKTAYAKQVFSPSPLIGKCLLQS